MAGVTSRVLEKRPGRHGNAIGIGFDIRGVDSFGQRIDELLGTRLPWIQQQAMKTVYRSIPVFARRDIQDEYNIRAGRVREHMAVRYIDDGTARRGGVRLVGQWKRGIGLMQYPGTRQLKRKGGVSYSVYRGRRQRMADAFIAPLLVGKGAQGNVHVVSRYGPKVLMKEGRYKGKLRQKLAVEYRSTVAQMLAHGRRPERIAERATQLLEQETRRLVARYFN